MKEREKQFSLFVERKYDFYGPKHDTFANLVRALHGGNKTSWYTKKIERIRTKYKRTEFLNDYSNSKRNK